MELVLTLKIVLLKITDFTFFQELKLVDEYEEQCVPSGGFAFQADPVQRS